VSGRPVVLVHGFATSSARTWGETGMLDLLRDMGREPVGIDLLGHGEADKPHDPDAYADLAGWLLDRLPEGPVDAVGYSLGAHTLLEVAARAPDRIARLVVAGAGENVLRTEAHSTISDAIERGAGEDDVVAQHFRQLAHAPGNDPLALAACMRRARGPLTREQLARVTCPVLVVIGDKDFAGPPEPLAEALPDATVKVLRNVDHFVLPKEFGFIDAVLEFLASAG
jgi:pimeloyl-ACP methyl ester carboxylesterase